MAKVRFVATEPWLITQGEDGFPDPSRWPTPKIRRNREAMASQPESPQGMRRMPISKAPKPPTSLSGGAEATAILAALPEPETDGAGSDDQSLSHPKPEVQARWWAGITPDHPRYDEVQFYTAVLVRDLNLAQERFVANVKTYGAVEARYMLVTDEFDAGGRALASKVADYASAKQATDILTELVDRTLGEFEPKFQALSSAAWLRHPH